MASKKAGRLAGLAALAGLAYMANKKGEGAKDTAAANNRIADARAAREEEKGPASKPSEEAKKPFKDAMFEKEPGPYLTDDKAMYEKEPGFETKTTPAKVASVSSPASKPAQTSRLAVPRLRYSFAQCRQAIQSVSAGTNRGRRISRLRSRSGNHRRDLRQPGCDSVSAHGPRCHMGEHHRLRSGPHRGNRRRDRRARLGSHGPNFEVRPLPQP